MIMYTYINRSYICNMLDMTVIILTKNEEANIERCINSVKGWVERIVVVDSGSTDRTVELAENLGAEIYHHEPFCRLCKAVQLGY